ncbi:MAG TPA: hypothetical protein VLT86_02540 [Vicinamibacterales bacterium]|nr:hypothetical protein [Vicinamibacterales bacterium]
MKKTLACWVLSAGCCVLGAGCLVLGASNAYAQGGQMPDPKQISGVPLPAADLPAGAVSVRVVRGAFTNNVTNQAVEFTVDGKRQTKTTDAQGRVELTGLTPGTKIRAVTVVDGERLESQEITMAASGIRVVLVAIDPEAAKREAEDKRLAAGPAVKGMVVLGSESRVIAEFSDERLNIFYVLQILNTARTPVDTGGPFVVDLPREAQGAALMDGSSPRATVTSGRLTVTGPFPPGPTTVQLAYELPYSTGTARIDQTWPAELQEVTVLVQQIGGLGLESPQLTAKQDINDQGQALILGSGPLLPAGKPMTIEITGLPHHALWPRYTALALAGLILTAGVWAAAVPARRRRVA